MVIEYLGHRLIKPSAADIDSRSVTFRYDALSDTLTVHFFGEARPAFSLDVSDVENLRVELDTNRIVGLQVEAFLSHALRSEPRYVVWAMRASISLEAIFDALHGAGEDALHEAAVKMAVDDLDYASD
ncbi:MAG TPA: hypothetical protein VMM78_03965 [Thermomicrobiales bacterium]|nr:hypothetical protein [Thermomicrobiales bacterium]